MPKRKLYFGKSHPECLLFFSFGGGGEFRPTTPTGWKGITPKTSPLSTTTHVKSRFKGHTDGHFSQVDK